MDTVIEVKNLQKSFRNMEILRGIDLKLHKGENIGIIGKSGCGKSVLTKCIVRLVEPDEGEVYISGNDVLTMNDNELTEIRKKVGYLFQGGALYDSMNIRENLEFPIRRTQFIRHRQEVESMVVEALENVGLLSAIHKMPAELSVGMRKRIGLARAIILKPEIIFYDEPTSGLDRLTAGEISDLIVEIQEKYQASSIIITHDLKCAKTATNNIKLLKNGLFYAQGTFDELSHSDDKEVRDYLT
jgi:phospholipid/cholesterol/gamma-HCH transport system ATP-binding protein